MVSVTNWMSCSVGLALLAIAGCGAPDENGGASNTREKVEMTTQAETTELPRHGTLFGSYGYLYNESYYGYALRTDQYVRMVDFQYWNWQTSSPGTTAYYGSNTLGTAQPWVECSDPNGWFIGVYGRSGSWIDKLGFICDGSNSPEYLTASGGEGGDEFTDFCPSGQHITYCGIGWTTDLITAIQCYCQ